MQIQMLIVNIAIGMVLGNHVTSVSICFHFAVIELNLFRYTFTDIENNGKLTGGGRVEESEGGSGGEGGSGCNVSGLGGSGGSGGNVDSEGEKEQRVVGQVLVVGVAGDIKIVSEV